MCKRNIECIRQGLKNYWILAKFHEYRQIDWIQFTLIFENWPIASVTTNFVKKSANILEEGDRISPGPY
jgi:hypothetical protein